MRRWDIGVFLISVLYLHSFRYTAVEYDVRKILLSDFGLPALDSCTIPVAVMPHLYVPILHGLCNTRLFLVLVIIYYLTVKPSINDYKIYRGFVFSIYPTA